MSTDQGIIVFSDRADLFELLREAVPGRKFAVPADATGREQIAIVDSNRVEDSKGGRFTFRILLGDSAGFDPIDDGVICIRPEIFEANPLQLLGWCDAMVRGLARVGSLEQELEFARQVSELLTDTDFDRVAETIAGRALDLLGVGRGTLLLHDPERERFVRVFSNDPEHRDSGEFVPGVPASLLEPAEEGDPGYRLHEPEGGKPGIIGIPVHVGDDVLGVLVGRFDKGEVPDEKSAAKAALYIRSVTAVLANLQALTRSNELAMRDDLTKAFNRRFFDSYLDQEIQRARRYGSGFSIIFLDLDDLKEVNNRWGHLMGSRTLQEVAKRILGAVRGIDRVVRFGGDEFCIILPQTDDEQAEAVANRVRRAIAEAPFELEPDVVVRITASFGIASYPKHANTKETLIRAADSAMYKVKSSTKDAIKVANGG